MWSNIYYRKTQLRKELKNTAKKYLSGAKRGTLIDYGCGTRPYEPVFAPYVSNYIGLDIKDNEHVDYVLSDSGKSCLPDATAEVVLSTQVLEHVPEPEPYLTEAHRLIVPGGFLFLSTHGHMIYHPTPEDYWRWTHQGLRKILEDAGFNIREVRGIIGRTATGAQYILDGVRTVCPKVLRGPLNLLMQGVIGVLDCEAFNPDRDQDASIFLVIAKKS